VQRLGTTEYRGKGLKGCTDNIVVRLLGSEGTAGSLGMKPKPQRTGILCLESFFHDLCPHPPSGPEFCYLLKEVQMGVKEKREPGSEGVHTHASFKGSFHIGECDSH
jgi:hypothetical protein